MRRSWEACADDMADSLIELLQLKWLEDAGDNLDVDQDFFNVRVRLTSLNGDELSLTLLGNLIQRINGHVL